MLFLAIALVASGQTSAEQSARDEPLERPAKVGPAESRKKICRTSQPESGVSTGTLMGPSRVCRTVEQWAKIDAKMQAKVD